MIILLIDVESSVVFGFFKEENFLVMPAIDFFRAYAALFSGNSTYTPG
jgi:hypothetical protein